MLSTWKIYRKASRILKKTRSVYSAYPLRYQTGGSSLDSATGRLLNHKYKPKMLVSTDQLQDFIRCYDTFLLDCDGVLWRNDTSPIPNIAAAVKKLQTLNKNILFVTNNSIFSRQQLSEKVLALGFEVDLRDIFSSAYVSAWYLKHVTDADSKVYVIGSEGMKAELNQLGIKNFAVGSRWN